jgi:putative ABC transport system ATP-binding protein
VSLLELDHVSKRYRCGSAPQRQALHEVSLELHPSEFVVVWGVARSGRSTLLRIAAGIEPPDSGTVRFRGRPLASGGVIAAGIAHCLPGFRGAAGRPVIEELILAQLALGVSASQAKTQAWAVLERTGARDFAQRRSHELDGAEATRASIARALARSPSLLLIDEPTTAVDVLARGAILMLLRSLANEGLAVLATIGESTALFGPDRVLSLCEGELRGHLVPEFAEVVELRRRVSC